MEGINDIAELLFFVSASLLVLDWIEWKGLGGEDAVKRYLAMTDAELKLERPNIDKADAVRLRLHAQIRPFLRWIAISTGVIAGGTNVLFYFRPNAMSW